MYIHNIYNIYPADTQRKRNVVVWKFFSLVVK